MIFNASQQLNYSTDNSANNNSNWQSSYSMNEYWAANSHNSQLQSNASMSESKPFDANSYNNSNYFHTNYFNNMSYSYLNQNSSGNESSYMSQSSTNAQFNNSEVKKINLQLNEEKNETSLIKSSRTSENSFLANIPSFFTTQKIQSSAAKLSYTAYQLELLNAIYKDMKYPNSVQKTLIAKTLGITRDQLKIWFQNRRRKETLVSQGKLSSEAALITKTKSMKRRKSTDNLEANEDGNSMNDESCSKKRVVDNHVIENVLKQLKSHKNAPSRLCSKRNNLPKASDSEVTKLTIVTSTPHTINYANKSLLTSASSSSSSSEEDSCEQNKPKFHELQESQPIQEYVSTKYFENCQINPQLYTQYQPYQSSHTTYSAPQSGLHSNSLLAHPTQHYSQYATYQNSSYYDCNESIQSSNYNYYQNF